MQAFVILCSLVHSELAADVDNTNSDKSSEKIAASTPPECGLYLVPSAIQGQGRSIVAGKFINKGQAIDHSVTLGLREADCLQTQLMNYVFATNESDIAMTEIGVGMLYNHHPSPAVHHSWDTEVIELASAQKLAHTTFSTVATTASRDIQGMTFHPIYLQSS